MAITQTLDCQPSLDWLSLLIWPTFNYMEGWPSIGTQSYLMFVGTAPLYFSILAIEKSGLRITTSRAAETFTPTGFFKGIFA
jgi:hypothetical protein